MKTAILATILGSFPALLAAQQSSAAASATAPTSAQTSVNVPASYSAEGKAKIEAAFQAAHEKNLPDQLMRQRIDDGQAKGATEAQVVAAVQQMETRLEESQSVLIRAGRAKPQPAEVASADAALASGATAAQIEEIVKHTPANEPLVFGANGAADANAAAGGATGPVNAAAGAAGAGDSAKARAKGAARGAAAGAKPSKKP